MIDTIMISDMNGQNIAQFLMFDDQVIGIPMTSLTAEYLKNQNLPTWVPPGCRYTRGGFLDYLARAAIAVEYPASFSATRSGGNYSMVHLTRYMHAEDLAAVTGYDLEEVRKFMAGHLTFSEEP
jgi:hypothetical protein